MPPTRAGYVDIAPLLEQVSIAEVFEHYGCPLPTESGRKEVRTACRFTCCPHAGETSERAIAVNVETNQFKCYHDRYGCGQGGGITQAIDLFEPGGDGHPKGERFKSVIIPKLLALANGDDAHRPYFADEPKRVHTAPPVKTNLPLCESDNDKARQLESLDVHFLLPDQLGKMPPEAAGYFRRRPWLTPEVCRRFRIGYLPSDGPSMMRGGVVYAYQNADGKLLSWFKRNVKYEKQQRRWLDNNREGTEPQKFKFVKGFFKGIELWGEQLLGTLSDVRDELDGIGLPVVEGPNDVMRLATFGYPAVALCNCAMTRAQAVKIGRLARTYADGVALLLGDLDEEGERGMKVGLGYLSQVAAVRVGWSPKMFGGKFKGMQPEQLSLEAWEKEIIAYAKSGEPNGWTFEGQ